MTMDDNRKVKSAAEIERVAYHEAGHAVACIWFDVPLDEVTTVADGGY